MGRSRAADDAAGGPASKPVLGHPPPPEDRPHRLPLADPPLHRPAARFLFVAPAEVPEVADRFNAIPFDVDGTTYPHRDDRLHL